MRYLLIALLVPVLAFAAIDSVKVKGTVLDARNTPVRGVSVTASIGGINITDTTSFGDTAYIIIPTIIKASNSDENGYWYMWLRRSDILTDTQLYDIVGYYGEKKVFELNDLTVPNVDSLDLADSLAGR